MSNSKTFELYSNAPIPQYVKNWLDKKASNRRNFKMSSLANIDICFLSSYEPIDILKKLLNTGWSFIVYSKIEFMDENEDWCIVDPKEFSIDRFLEKNKGQDSLCVSLVLENDIGCSVIIYRDWISFLLSINRVNINDQMLPDFSWYLNNLHGFLKLIPLKSIKCEFIP